MSRQRSIENIRKSKYVSIGELVRLTNSRYSTLKYYTEEGLLPFMQEDTNLTRRYNRETSIKRIEEIKALKNDGLSIMQIKNKLLK